MATTDIRWTVLPDGVAADGRLRLTALVSPQLSGGSTLRDFPDFLRWPTVLAGYLPSLRIEFWHAATGIAVPAEPRTDRYPPADETLWTLLFNNSTPVRPPQTAAVAMVRAGAAPVKQTLRSFPTKAVHGHIGALYANVATGTASRRVTPGGSGEGGGLPGSLPPWDLPQPEDVLGVLTDDVRVFARDIGASYTALDTLMGRPAPPPPINLQAAPADNPYRPYHMDRGTPGYQANGGTASNFAEACRFYDRPQQATSPPPATELDFLAACALLADYPELLRRFGLAVDLLVTAPPGLADQWQARVAFAAPGTGLNSNESMRPWTVLRYVAGQRFEPYAADDSFYGRRMLNLGDAAVHVTDLDVDGAAMKFVEFARTVDQAYPGPAGTLPSDTVAPDTTAPPALHGAGITVLCENRDGLLADQMEADARNTAGVDAAGQPATAPAVLDAAGLVRGYRADVGTVDTATGQVTVWHPLCARTGTYTIRQPGQDPVPVTVAPDEGHVKASAVTTDKTDPSQHYVHQALFGWHGWSLAAPRPGRTIGTDNQAEVASPPVSPVFPLDTKFQPLAGTLPWLRYGASYRLRARLADLAGNGLGPGAATDPAVATETITYARWEPVPHPVIVPRWPYLEGESEPRLVIRSTVTDNGTAIPPEAWAIQRNGQVPDHAWRSPGDGLDRRYRSFDERHIAPPKTSLAMAEQHGVYDAAFGPAKPASLRQQYYAAASREAGTFLDTVVSYPQNPELTVDLKQLGMIHVAKHDVHDTAPLTELPVRRGAGLPSGEYVVHDADQLILPYLPDVPVRGVSLRGLPGGAPNEACDLPGPWPAAAPFRLRIEEGDGAPRWTGPRELTVYLPKATVATVRMSCRIDPNDLSLFRHWRALTGSAMWNDPALLTQDQKDELATASANGENWLITPWVELTLVHAVEKPLAAPALTGLSFTRQAGQTFADIGGTLHANAASTGRADIEANWTEWVDDVIADAPAQVTHTAHVGDVTLGPADDEYFLDGRIRQEFHDTKHRTIAYTATATTRFREFFHPVITGQPALITRAGPASAECRVPSSRRPDPPQVAYVVPTVTWARTADPAQHRVTQTRAAAGVRVYLRRPWFSSGDDEMLAVVLDPGSGLPDHLVTRCGTDPVWQAGAAPPALTPANFPNAAVTAASQTLAEQVNGTPAAASMVAFAPVYDPRQKLWYCDIDVDLGTSAAYFPYLRLALARYQPYSVDPLGLSAVTGAEFTQLLPDRTVTATELADNRIQLELDGPAGVNTVGHLAGTGQPAAAASRRVMATVQRRGVTDGDLDWAAAGPALELECAARGTGYVWSGALTPPAPERLPLSQYRLLVEEHEIYQADTAVATGTVTLSGQEIPVGQRLVHADYLTLTVSPLGTIALGE